MYTSFISLSWLSFGLSFGLSFFFYAQKFIANFSQFITGYKEAFTQMERECEWAREQEKGNEAIRKVFFPIFLKEISLILK